jgi:hypothetical protein
MGAQYGTPDSADAADVARTVDAGIAAPGRPLGGDVRAEMERRFGHDLGPVRVHEGPAAAASARDLGARAYAVGRHVVVGDDAAGPDVLAHELTHVLQQRAHWDAPVRPAGIARADAPAEREAAAAPRTVAVRATPALVHRQQRPDAGAPDAGARDAGARDAGAPDAGAPAAAPGAATYAAGVAGVRALDPALHRLLSMPSLGGPAVAIRSGTQTDPTTTPPTAITYAFNLRIVQGAPAGTSAKFESDPPSFTRPAPASASLVVNMTITVADPATVTPAALSRDLYHEAVHLALFMDRLVPARDTAAYTTGFGAYTRAAAASASRTTLAAELEVHIDLDLSTRGLGGPGRARSDAEAILANVLEEKYVFDQERAKVGTVTPNAGLAAGYLRQGFGLVGVHQPRPADFTRMVGLLTAVLDDIDRSRAPAPVPAPAPAPAPRP